MSRSACEISPARWSDWRPRVRVDTSWCASGDYAAHVAQSSRSAQRPYAHGNGFRRAWPRAYGTGSSSTRRASQKGARRLPRASDGGGPAADFVSDRRARNSGGLSGLSAALADCELVAADAADDWQCPPRTRPCHGTRVSRRHAAAGRLLFERPAYSAGRGRPEDAASCLVAAGRLAFDRGRTAEAGTLFERRVRCPVGDQPHSGGDSFGGSLDG